MASVIISSPNFPQKYAKSVQCTWKIEAPEGCKLRLEFLAFDLEEPNFFQPCRDLLVLR